MNFNLNKKVDAVIVADIGFKLTLINIELKPDIKVTAFKSVNLPSEKTDVFVASALNSFVKEFNIAHRNLILKPLLKSLVIKRLRIPAVPGSELLDAIKWQIKDEVSFDIAKSVIDYLILEKIAKEDGSKELDIICVLAEEQEAKEQVLLFKQIGFSCIGVKFLVSGYENLIDRFMKVEKEQTIGILHFDEKICYIIFYKNGRMEFYRELPTSIASLKESLRGTLVSDSGKITLTDQEAEEVLYKIGVPDSTDVQAVQGKLSSSQVLAMLRMVLERISSEIKRSLAYYNSQYQGENIKKILIGGLATRIPNIDKFLTQELSLDFQKISLKDKIAVSNSVNIDELSQSYADIGLALNYNRGINLLPFEFRSERIEKMEKKSLRWIAFIACLLLGVTYIFAKLGVTAYKKHLDSKVFYLNSLYEIRQTKVGIDEFGNFIRDVRALELPVYLILEMFNRVSGEELFFNTLKLDCATKTGEIVGFIKSIGKNPDVILSDFVRQIENSGLIKDAEVEFVSKALKQGFAVTDFRITLKLK